MSNQLINIIEWNQDEVRVEIFGNGHYIPKEHISDWIRENADKIAMEVRGNIKEMPLTCEVCSSKLTGEEGMMICHECQDEGDSWEDESRGNEPHGSLIV